MQQHKEFRHYILHLICNEHLAAKQLDFIALHIEVVLHLREVKDTGKIERIIYIEVYPKDRIRIKGI